MTVNVNGEDFTINHFEHFRKIVIIEAGFYELNILLDGRISIEAKSISFSMMDEIEFEDLYNKVIDVILKYFLIGTKKADLEEEIIYHFV